MRWSIYHIFTFALKFDIPNNEQFNNLTAKHDMSMKTTITMMTTENKFNRRDATIR